MSRIRIALLAALATAVVAVAPSAAMAPATLNGTVGPGFTITLTKGGAKVTSLTAGKYTIVVNDKSAIHNFHLTGPGVNKTTGVGAIGKSTWTVTLKKGKKYQYICTVPGHAAGGMKGTFKAT